MTGIVELGSAPDPGFARAWTLAAAFLKTTRSPNTLSAYRNDLFGCPCDRRACDHPDPDKQPNPLAWLRWLAQRGVNPLEVRAAVVELWIGDLAHAGQAEGTQARRLATVSAFYRWLYREDQVPFNPVDKLHHRPQFRERGTAGTALPHTHAMQLLAAADADSPRSAAVVALGLYQGLRVSDITGLDLSGYGPGPDGGSELTYTTKGRKKVRAEVVPEVDRRIRAWLAARSAESATDRLPTRTAGATVGRPMFTTSSGARMSRAQLYRLVVKLAKRAGIPVHISPHDMRRTFGTQADAEGAQLGDIQADMGHASQTTTQGYVRRQRGSHSGHLIAAAHARLQGEAMAAEVRQDGAGGGAGV